ncbi:MAG: hypothetical protein IKV48_06215, partial [Eggerthellaceae bacterium]|nr:hypothetical protein [Eggerthellaceae bacterium]
VGGSDSIGATALLVTVTVLHVAADFSLFHSCVSLLTDAGILASLIPEAIAAILQHRRVSHSGHNTPNACILQAQGKRNSRRKRRFEKRQTTPIARKKQRIKTPILVKI